MTAGLARRRLILRRRRISRLLRVVPGGLGSAPEAPAERAPAGSTVRGDVAAGIVVFLVALPLCLGIALASGAPLLSGVISGVVGGVLVAWLSGSQLMVSGPAAGLAAVVLDAITRLGSFDAFLVAVVLAGVIQIGLGLMRAGVIGHYLPSSVVKGMLAAIGALLILKQLPHALGFGPDVFGSSSFAQPGGGNTFTGILAALRHAHAGAVLLSLVSLLVLLAWDHPRLRAVKARVPAALAVVLVGVLANWMFAAAVPAFEIPARGLVQLPLPSGARTVHSYLTFPDWSVLRDVDVYRVAVIVALVASLESLLSLEATDKLGPYEHATSPDRELVAQGIGNTVCGLIGGLPMTGVIVRSAANVEAGGRTRLASFAHGVFLLGAVLAIPALLNRIPLAVLGTILIYTGFKLAHPRLVRDMLDRGSTQFVPFAATVAAIMFTDLLEGVLIGLGVAVFFILRNHGRTAYVCQHDQSAGTPTVRIRLAEDVSFLNKASLRRLLHGIPGNSVVKIDASRVQHLDDDVLELLTEFRRTAHRRGIDLRVTGVTDPVPAVEVVR